MGAVERRLLVNSQRHSGWMLPDSVQPFVFFFAFSEYFFVDAEENKRRVALVLVEWPLVKDPITWNGLSMTTAVRLTESISHLSFHWPTGTVLDVFPAAVVAPWNSSKTIDSFQHAVLTLSYRAWFSHHQVWIRHAWVAFSVLFGGVNILTVAPIWTRLLSIFRRNHRSVNGVWRIGRAEAFNWVAPFVSTICVSRVTHTGYTHTRRTRVTHAGTSIKSSRNDSVFHDFRLLFPPP